MMTARLQPGDECPECAGELDERPLGDNKLLTCPECGYIPASRRRDP